jgi:hypothetical protein
MLTSFRHISIFSLFLAVFFIPQYPTYAEETYLTGTIMTTATFRFNNENWNTLPHPQVATFTVRDDGSAYGLTETNIPFTQDNVANDFGIRIQRFEIQDHYHYIVEGTIAYSLEELSAELAQYTQNGQG